MEKWKVNDEAPMTDTCLRGYASATREEMEAILGPVVLCLASDREKVTGLTPATTMRWRLEAEGHGGDKMVVEVYDRNWLPKPGEVQTWHIAAQTSLDCEQFLRWLAMKFPEQRDVVPLMWIPPSGISIYRQD